MYQQSRGPKRFGGKSFGRNDGERSEMFKATCVDCGSACEVPFRPNGRKPVLCSDCFKRDGGGSQRDDRGSRGDDRGSRMSFDRGDDRGSRAKSFRGGNDRFDRSDRQMHDAICDECNSECQVPFMPTQGKPVLCSACFGEKGSQRKSRSEKISEDQFKSLNDKLDRILSMIGGETKASKKVTEEPKEVKFVEEVKPTKKASKKSKSETKEVVEIEEGKPLKKAWAKLKYKK